MANLFYLTNDDTKVVTVSVKKSADGAPTLTLEISEDGENWTTLGQTSTEALSVEIPVGGKVYMRCPTATRWGTSESVAYTYPSAAKCNYFSSDGKFGAHGSIMELLMRTTLLSFQCQCMFYGCTGLTTAPELPATTLRNFCYCAMFSDCTGLTTAPELPATTLTRGCYYYMFYRCSNLSSVRMLATSDTSVAYCLKYWLLYVASSGVFTCADGMEDVLPRGESGIPIGWTVKSESEYQAELALEEHRRHAFLNYHGLVYLWGKIKAIFASKADVSDLPQGHNEASLNVDSDTDSRTISTKMLDWWGDEKKKYLTSHQTANNLVSTMSNGDSAVTDNTDIITSHVQGFTASNAVNKPYKRKASYLWAYIQSKINSAGYVNKVDEALSSTSTNPVQNRAVKMAIDGKPTVVDSDTWEEGQLVVVANSAADADVNGKQVKSSGLTLTEHTSSTIEDSSDTTSRLASGKLLNEWLGKKGFLTGQDITGKVTKGSPYEEGQVLVAGANGVAKTSGFTIEKSVPATAVFTDTDTHHEAKLYAGDAVKTDGHNAVAANPYLKLVENRTLREKVQLKGEEGYVEVSSDTGGVVMMKVSETVKGGLMSSAQKTKLDGIEEKATANRGTVTGVSVNGGSVASPNADGVVDITVTEGSGTSAAPVGVALGACTTAAGAAAKVATVTYADGSDFVLKEGVIVGIYGSAVNTATNPTLNVNGTGAYPVWYNNAKIGTSDVWAAMGTRRHFFVFATDRGGSTKCWQFLSAGMEVDTKYGKIDQSYLNSSSDDTHTGLITGQRLQSALSTYRSNNNLLTGVTVNGTPATVDSNGVATVTVETGSGNTGIALTDVYPLTGAMMGTGNTVRVIYNVTSVNSVPFLNKSYVDKVAALAIDGVTVDIDTLVYDGNSRAYFVPKSAGFHYVDFIFKEDIDGGHWWRNSIIPKNVIVGNAYSYAVVLPATVEAIEDGAIYNSSWHWTYVVFLGNNCPTFPDVVGLHQGGTKFKAFSLHADYIKDVYSTYHVELNMQRMGVD